MEETTKAKRRMDFGTTHTPLRIFIPCTAHDLVSVALNAAAAMMNELEAEVTLVCVNVVPFPLPLDRPDVGTEHLVQSLRAMCDASSVSACIEMVLARDRQAAIRKLLPARSLVVLATRKHWWRTAEESLARALQRDGHRVVLLKLNAAGPVREGDHDYPLQGVSTRGTPEVKLKHA